MNELARILASFTPGAAGIWVGVLMFAGWWLKEWRETRKLSLDDRLARRDGYAAQVASLTTENRNLRADLAEIEERHSRYRELCHKETDQLRSHVVRLEDRVAGLMRTLADVAVRAARGDIDATMAASILALAQQAEKPIVSPSLREPDA